MTAGPTLLPMAPGRVPRDWQLRCTLALRDALRRWARVVASAATGTGKGDLLAGLAVRSAALGKQVFVVVHRDELIQDLAARVARVEGAPTVGVVKAERDEWQHPVVVISIQSMTVERRARMPWCDLVIIDEAHHAPAPGYVAMLDACAEVNPALRVVGVTATPFRAGEGGTTTGLGGVFDALVFEYPIWEAIENGDLVPLRAFQVDTRIDISAIPMTGGDFDEAKLAKAIDIPARNELVVKAYGDHGGGAALVFAASVAHAQHLAESFVAAGIPAAAVWGDMPRDDRKRLVADYQEGRLDVLVSKDLLFEGFDAPRTRLLLKARPTQSRVVYQQTIGRGLRLYGVHFTDEPADVRRELIAASIKPFCIFVDLVDNGCALDLQTAADLTNPGAAEKKAARQLQDGDHVRRWHHDEWGVGVVVETTPGEVALAKVDWPPTGVHPGGIELTHPQVELRYVRPQDVAEEPPIRVEVGITASTYEVFLLPGVRRRDRVGFYEYSGTLSVGGLIKGGHGNRLVVLVRPRDAAWEVWERNGLTGVTTRRHRCATQGIALAWADSHIRGLAVELVPVGADGTDGHATAAQKRLLRSAGVTRDAAEMTMGEATALLDAVLTLRDVRRLEDPAKFARAEFARGAYRRGFKRSA